MPVYPSNAPGLRGTGLLSHYTNSGKHRTLSAATDPQDTRYDMGAPRAASVTRKLPPEASEGEGATAPTLATVAARAAVPARTTRPILPPLRAPWLEQPPSLPTPQPRVTVKLRMRGGMHWPRVWLPDWFTHRLDLWTRVFAVAVLAAALLFAFVVIVGRF